MQREDSVSQVLKISKNFEDISNLRGGSAVASRENNQKLIDFFSLASPFPASEF